MRLLLPFLAILFATPAHAEWWEARTEHFVIYSESSAADTKTFAQKLERFDGALRSLQTVTFKPITSDAQRVTVYRFGDTGDMGRLAGSSGVAGFYRPRLGGSVAFTPSKPDFERVKSLTPRDRRTDLDPQSVLFHEYTHSFMFQSFPAAYPSWYIEGFAETAATIVLKDDGTFHIGNPPQYRSDALFGGLNYSIKRMLLTSEKPDFEDVYGRYTYGWLLTHFLTFEPTRKGQLVTYLKLINAGTGMSEAARQAFGDLDKLQSDVERYKNRRPLPGAEVKPATIVAPQVAMRQLGPDEVAIMPIRSRSKAGVDRRRAKDVAGDARAIAAKYPNSYLVQVSLAEAEFDAGNFDAAERAADAALAVIPRASEALLDKGQILLEKGKSNKANYAAARPWFAKALAADPVNPAPLYFNYLSYFQAGEAIPDNAILGLEQAYERARYDSEVRLVLIRQLLSEKNGDLARALLIPLALAPHESKRAKIFSQVADLIEANKLEEARQMLVARLNEEEDEKNGKKKKKS